MEVSQDRTGRAAGVWYCGTPQRLVLEHSANTKQHEVPLVIHGADSHKRLAESNGLEGHGAQTTFRKQDAGCELPSLGDRFAARANVLFPGLRSRRWHHLGFRKTLWAADRVCGSGAHCDLQATTTGAITWTEVRAEYINLRHWNRSCRQSAGNVQNGANRLMAAFGHGVVNQNINENAG